MTQNTTFRNRFLGKIMDSLYNWWMAGTLTGARNSCYSLPFETNHAAWLRMWYNKLCMWNKLIDTYKELCDSSSSFFITQITYFDTVITITITSRTNWLIYFITPCKWVLIFYIKVGVAIRRTRSKGVSGICEFLNYWPFSFVSRVYFCIFLKGHIEAAGRPAGRPLKCVYSKNEDLQAKIGEK